MFERFTQAARVAVVLAQEGARDAGADQIGAEHLLHAALGDRAGVVAEVLARWGVDAAVVSAATRQVHDLDDQALSALGIDVDEVRKRAEATFGPGALDRPGERGSGRGRRLGKGGHLPFTDEAKRALELALRAAVAAHDREVTTAHLLLGMLGTEQGTAARLLARVGVTATPGELGRLVRERMDDAA